MQGMPGKNNVDRQWEPTFTNTRAANIYSYNIIPITTFCATMVLAPPNVARTIQSCMPMSVQSIRNADNIAETSNTNNIYIYIYIYIPGQALHEKGLQRQIGVGPLVSSQERRAAVVRE